MATKNLKHDNIISDKIEFKAKTKESIKRKTEGIFYILKRCNYLGNYKMNPNVTNKLCYIKQELV